jgi:hypothetical protein
MSEPEKVNPEQERLNAIARKAEATGERGKELRFKAKQALNRSEAALFAHNATLGNPRYRFRIAQALEAGTLPPQLEQHFLERAYGKTEAPSKEKSRAAVGRLINLMLRKDIREDPLGEAKVIEAKEIERAPIKGTIVPPSRPHKKPKPIVSTAPPLKPGESPMS